MISKLECNDFPKKEYVDIIDDCPVFIRKESCNHYEIKMRRESEDCIFKQYIIKFVCKGCNFEEKLISNEKEHKFQYNCLKCKYPVMTFYYINTAEIDSSEKEKEINKDIIQSDINIGYEIYIKDKLRGQQYEEYQKKEKAYKTPEEVPETKVKKVYSTPDSLAQKINSKNSNISKIKVKISYKNTSKEIEFNSEESIESQYDKLKKEFNFNGEKKLIFNSIEIDLKKTFRSNEILDGYNLELDDE